MEFRILDSSEFHFSGIVCHKSKSYYLLNLWKSQIVTILAVNEKSKTA
jgi:hypothetical protein